MEVTDHRTDGQTEGRCRRSLPPSIAQRLSLPLSFPPSSRSSPFSASREFNVVDNLSNLKELRLTFSSYSDDRYFLDPVFSPISTLRRLKVMIRSSWNGWDGLNAGHRPVGAYWNSLMGRVPDLRGVLLAVFRREFL